MTSAKILIADDDELVRDAISKILELFGHQVITADSGNKALELLKDDIDLIILDINMPEMDGFETMKAINAENMEIPVLFFTGVGTMEYAVKAINLGAYDFIPKPIEDLDIFNVKIRRALEKRMYVLKERSYKINLEQEIRDKTRELAEKNKLLEQYSHHLEISAVNTITTLQTALEEKDKYTAGHTKRVTEYSQLIGRALNLSKDDMLVLTRACQLHDIGKLVIDVSCIQKPGPLSKEEWQRVKRHPEIGENIIKPLTFLAPEGRIIRHHHERVDGKGYPDGLTGDKLDILTKIVTLADSYDAMTSTRSYKKNSTMEEAFAELRKHAGSQFDSEVVEIFIKALKSRRGKQ